MRRIVAHTSLVFASVLLMALSGCGSNRSSGDGTTVAQTSEEILRATAFVGADRCAGCHGEIHDGWQETAHTQKLRDGSLEANYVNDNAGGSPDGRADFFQGVDVDIRTLEGGSKFDVFGLDAPILGSSGGQAYIKIGGIQYDIVFTLGGSAVQSPEVADTDGDRLILNDEAQWKQRYITKIGNSHYILPVQYNVKNQQYTTYHPEDWYDGSNLPIEIGTSRSYERRCAGCHVTGLQVSFLQESEEWTMSFSDISVACEACHGPGGRHATSPTKANIINPETVTASEDLNDDGTIDQVDNLIVQNYVCYHCHSRGSGKHKATGSSGTQTLAYSSKTGSDGSAQIYLPGLDWREYYDISTKGTDYWGGDPTSGEFITSKSHHQQQQDHANSHHGADEVEDSPCFACHDLHFADKEHLVAAEIERDGISIDNGDADSNTNLCLACHSGSDEHFVPGSFKNLTAADLNLGTAAVDAAMATHVLKDAFMDVAPPGLQCSDCHMPDTAKSALEGDVKSHTFEIIWPNFVQQPGSFSWSGFQKWWKETEDFVDPGDGSEAFATVGLIPNSCITSDCHNGTNPTGATDIVFQWTQSGHADGFGEPFNHWNADGEISGRCSKCHTEGGYIQFVEGEEVAAQSVIFPKVLGCETCHEHEGSGQTYFEVGLVQGVAFPNDVTLTLGDSSNICMECHQGRASGVTLKEQLEEDDFGFVNRHYLAAASIMFGKEADAGFQYRDDAEYVGQNTYPGHEGTLNTCTSCHMRQGAANHLMEPDISVCNDCHIGITDFNDLGLASGPDVDYDGDGTGESFQAEIDGVSAVLLDAIQDYADGLGAPIIYSAGAYPYFFNDTDGDRIVDESEASYSNRYGSFDDTLLQAAYNYHSNQDPCSDNHNYKYVLQTAYDSLDDLDDGLQNNSVAGGILRP